MKKLLTPILTLVAFAGFIYLQSCDKPCVEKAEDPCTCPEEERPDSCFEDTGDVDTTNQVRYGSLRVIVKKKGQTKPLNTYSSFAVLGRTSRHMYFFEYITNQLPGFEKPKPVLKSYGEHEENGEAIDSAYSRPNNETDPSTNESAGAIVFDSIPEGTYYLHAFDGGLNKYVGQVTITSNTTDDDIMVVEVQPLGKLKVTVAQSSIVGTELDSAIFRLYGTTSDTIQAVAKADLNEIEIEPYYEGRTSTQVNEEGNQEKGIFYLVDIVPREYLVIGYSDLFATKDGEQATGFIRVRKNVLNKIRINFQ